MRKYAFTMIAVGVLLFVLSAHAHANLVELQPGPFDGMDMWYSNVYHRSGVHDEKLQVGGWGDQYQTLLRFNLGGMPQVADLAVLWLWGFPRGDSSTPTWIQWFSVTSQWQSATVGWDTRPYKFSLGYTQPPSTSGGWYGVNFTNQYNQWRRGNSSPLNHGLMLAPWQNNNNFDMFFSSRNPTYWARPLLYVYYTPQADDSVIKLTWPLYTPYAGRYVILNFKDESPITCDDGYHKQHNGVDYSATAGTAVYAGEDGIVKDVHYDSSGSWAYGIVLEHNLPVSGKFTTVSWHVNPMVTEGNFVPKGMQIATVANLGGNTHFHYGVRMGAYVEDLSLAGALPYANHPCDGYLIFPAGFVSPEDPTQVIFK